MTQVKSAQDERRKSAFTEARKPLTLAQRRGNLAARMREMALSDLERVAERLKLLHKRLEEHDGRRWTQQEIADKAGVPYRTYQSWVGAKVENSDGRGYDRLARFYSRKLGEKITRRWIVFGDEPHKEPTPDLMGKLNGNGDELTELRRLVMETLQANTEELTQLHATVAALESQVQGLVRELRETRAESGE